MDNKEQSFKYENSQILKPKAYIDPEYFVEEKKTIFNDKWCSIGFEHQIPKAGDLLPIEFCGLPLLLVRGKDQEVRVFHNTCPHRGTQLISKKSNNEIILCPYHSWSFQLSGTLIRAPHSIDVDIEKFALKKIKSHTWAGTIFINFSATQAPFLDTISPLLGRWRDYDLNHLKFGGGLTYDFKSNWKLIVENFLESYHVPSVHPKLAKYSNFLDRYPIGFSDEFFGQGSREYKPAIVNKELPRWPGVVGDQEYQAEYVSLFPNTLIGRMPDHFFVWSLDPLKIDRTVEHLSFYFLGDEAMEPNYKADRENCIALWKEVNDEDFDIVQRLYIGHKSPGFDGAKFVSEHEKPICGFHKLMSESL